MARFKTPEQREKHQRKANARRQRQFVERHRLLKEELETLLEAFVSALERGRSFRVVKGLPEGPREWPLELASRLESLKLVAFPREDKPGETY